MLSARTLFLVACVAACSEAPRTFESSRDVTMAGTELRLGAETNERFGLRSPGSMRGDAPSALDTVNASALQSDLAWTTPEGWIELPPRTMRAANFRVAGDERAECYLTLLSGEAGGLAANVNRWRTQMSQPPYSIDELRALTTSELLGRSAAFVDFTGTWTGMSSTDKQASYRLVGLLLVAPEGSAFLKMVGPDSVLATQIDAFRALAKSFRERRGDTLLDPHGTASAVNQDSTPKPAAADAAATADSQGSASGLRWTVPAGWTRTPERATRVVSYAVDAERETECYVTVLAGDAGGLLANVNRWRKQIGLDEHTAERTASYETITMLGGEAHVVEFTSADGKGLLLGALYFAPERSVFVKLNGPSERVAAQREAFRAFCRSIDTAQ
ncbi:MAG: hypothetical protein ACKVWV_03715 [Planctomycetota bacterium]